MVTVPLVLLAIPSVLAGWVFIEPMLFGDFFGESIVVRRAARRAAELREEWHGVGAFIAHGLLSAPFWLAVAGIVAAWFCYLVRPGAAGALQRAVAAIYTLLDNKYYFDRFNDWFFAGGARALGALLSNVGDRTIIDGFFVNGAATRRRLASALLRHMQSGYVYHYAFTMIIGVFALLTLVRSLATATMMPYLSSRHLGPDRRRLAVLAVGRDRDAALARWIALVGVRRRLPGDAAAVLRISTRHRPTCSSSKRATGFRASTSHYLLGVDGISMLFVLLNSLMTLFVVWAGWEVIEKRVAQYMAAFLIQSGLINGAFAALDGILFYLFFEAMLIPMYLIIGVWGGPNRVYAAIKFFLYTLLGSLLMLVALIYLYNVSETLLDPRVVPACRCRSTAQILLFVAFFLAFAVKVPMWPVHTWLPDAHVEAPTGGSVILAAITLKIGAYGFVRFILPIVPDASRATCPAS